LKWRQVKETLRRIGRLQEPPMRPFIPSPIGIRIRNRITVHVRDGVIGFFRRESNKLLDIEGCPIALSEVNAQLVELRGSRPRDGHYTLRAGAGLRVFIRRMMPSPPQCLIWWIVCSAQQVARSLMPIVVADFSRNDCAGASEK